MRKFRVENLHDVPIALTIEPWAKGMVIQPNSRVHFECDETEEIGIAVMGTNEISIAMWREPRVVKIQTGLLKI